MKQMILSVVVFNFIVLSTTINGYCQSSKSVKGLQVPEPVGSISLTEAATLFTTQPSRTSVLNYSTVAGGINNYSPVALSQPTSLSSTARVDIVPSSKMEIMVFPNPNKGVFSIKGVVANEQPVKILITNMVGQIVFQSLTNAIIGQFSYQVQLGQGMAPGQYNLIVIAGSQEIMHRVVVE